MVDAGVCGIGLYFDDHINQILDIDGMEKFVIYI